MAQAIAWFAPESTEYDPQESRAPGPGYAVSVCACHALAYQMHCRINKRLRAGMVLCLSRQRRKNETPRKASSRHQSTLRQHDRRVVSASIAARLHTTHKIPVIRYRHKDLAAVSENAHRGMVQFTERRGGGERSPKR
jgi:hypothetical protein